MCALDESGSIYKATGAILKDKSGHQQPKINPISRGYGASAQCTSGICAPVYSEQPKPKTHEQEGKCACLDAVALGRGRKLPSFSSLGWSPDEGDFVASSSTTKHVQGKRLKDKIIRPGTESSYTKAQYEWSDDPVETVQFDPESPCDPSKNRNPPKIVDPDGRERDYEVADQGGKVWKDYPGTLGDADNPQCCKDLVCRRIWFSDAMAKPTDFAAQTPLCLKPR